MVEALKGLAPPVLGVLAAYLFDALARRRGLEPPGFVAAPWRRFAFLLFFALVCGFTLFASLATVGESSPLDPSQIHPINLFLLHAVLLTTVMVWFVLGYVGPNLPGHFPEDWNAQLGLRAPRLATELGIGVVAGVAGWLLVISILVGFGLVVYSLAGPDALPQQPPELVIWIAGLPIALKVGIALSAGIFEELFFRGFLQPRIGLGLSTLLFAIAHLTYDQPLMLVGVTLLSIFYGLLVKWRQSLWAAIVAHALFDLVQLLVVIPLALRYLPGGGGPAAP